MKVNRILSFILITLLSIVLPLGAQTKSKSTSKAPATATATKGTAGGQTTTAAPSADPLIASNSAPKERLLTRPGNRDAYAANITSGTAYTLANSTTNY